MTTFEQPLIQGTLIRRYKRFLADVELDDGSLVTVHCPNTGSMKTCADPGWRVALSSSDNPKRKYKHTWEMVHNGTCWIGIHTGRANHIVEEAIINGEIPELTDYATILRERSYGTNSRIDLLLKNENRPDCYVEIKNTTLIMPDQYAAFPDAVTTRGLKHLNELIHVVNNGSRAVMFYLIQRTDCSGFRPAHEMDPTYARTMQLAQQQGVELLAYQATVSPERISVTTAVPIVLSCYENS